MEWSTHMLSGIVVGYAVTGGDWRGAVVGGVAAIIPDLDEPKSKFGKIFLPLSIPLNKIFGHRTFTHSLLFAVLMGAILMFFFNKWVWLAAFTGILAHIVGDMLTGKVKFFYPSKKSIGIGIHPSSFRLIDRVTRILLIIGIFFMLLSVMPKI